MRGVPPPVRRRAAAAQRQRRSATGPQFHTPGPLNITNVTPSGKRVDTAWRRDRFSALGHYEGRGMRGTPVPSPQVHEAHTAPRRDDFWRWGTLSIRRLPVLIELLERMLPRRYHKWYEDTEYEHHWEGPAEGDGTHQLFLHARVRPAHCPKPSVLRFRMKENPDPDDPIRIVIDYHRVITNPLHNWAIWTARDATCRLICEMDDWYAAEHRKERRALGEAAAERKRLLLEGPPASRSALRPSKSRGDTPPLAAGDGAALPPSLRPVAEEAVANYLHDGGRLWGLPTYRKERPVDPRAVYDPREWDLGPLKAPEWPIPRVEGNNPWARDRAGPDPNVHR